MAVATIRLCDLIAAGYPIDEKAFSKFPAPSDSVRREVAETIKREYWLREIGFQTPDEFAEQLSFALCQIMPLYNLRRTANALDLGVDPLLSFNEVASIVTDENGTTGEGRTEKDNTTEYSYSDETEGTKGGSTTTPGTTTTTVDSGKEYTYPITGDGGESGEFSPKYATSGDKRENKVTTTGTDTIERHDDTKTTVESIRQGGRESTGKTERTDKRNSHQLTERKGNNEARFRLLKEYRETLEDLNRMIAMDKKVAQCFYGLFA